MKNERFIFFVLVSIILHLILLIGIVLSKSVRFLKIPPQENVVFMHVLPMGKINNVKTRTEQQSDLPVQEEAKKVEKPAEQIKPEPAKEPEPEPEPIKEEPKETPQEDKKEAVDPQPAHEEQMVDDTNTPEPEKSEPKKPEPIKEQPKEEPKKAPIKKKPEDEKKKPVKKKKEDELDLKNLEKSLVKSLQDNNKEKASEGDQDKSKKKSGGKSQDNQTSSSDNYDPNSPESVTAKALLQKRIEGNWGKPPSMRDYEKLKVRVKLKLDMNQNIQEISGFEFLNETVPENVRNAIKESIIRAIKLSEPFDMLSLEHYDYWHDNSLVFSYK
jgi:hypothetical protein